MAADLDMNIKEIKRTKAQDNDHTANVNFV